MNHPSKPSNLLTPNMCIFGYNWSGILVSDVSNSECGDPLLKGGSTHQGQPWVLKNSSASFTCDYHPNDKIIPLKKYRKLIFKMNQNDPFPGQNVKKNIEGFGFGPFLEGYIDGHTLYGWMLPTTWRSKVPDIPEGPEITFALTWRKKSAEFKTRRSKGAGSTKKPPRTLSRFWRKKHQVNMENNKYQMYPNVKNG